MLKSMSKARTGVFLQFSFLMAKSLESISFDFL